MFALIRLKKNCFATVYETASVFQTTNTGQPRTLTTPDIRHSLVSPDRPTQEPLSSSAMARSLTPSRKSIPKKSTLRAKLAAECDVFTSINAIQKRIQKRTMMLTRASRKAAASITAALDYIAREVLDVAIVQAQEAKRHRINPRMLYLAVEKDEELAKLFKNSTFVSAGKMVKIHPALLGKKAAKKIDASGDVRKAKKRSGKSNSKKKTVKRSEKAKQETPMEVDQ
ncbi:hypothetical protein L596_019233 [Steinernema carpocapsae]|uniref:Histone H2A n=1 Tax=Steinernema carpocapsae TaxID=34508 RepID=A0A4U5MQU3_STECR|nr:hypothetical protein L596_019233 [Steinernema carpocapsae]